MTHLAKFNIGDIVKHKQQGYRAIIVDIDPIFQASGQYHHQTAERMSDHKNPWYRLLVDKTSQMTYVEESLLCPDPETVKNPFENPLMKQYNQRKLH